MRKDRVPSRLPETIIVYTLFVQMWCLRKYPDDSLRLISRSLNLDLHQAPLVRAAVSAGVFNFLKNNDKFKTIETFQE